MEPIFAPLGQHSSAITEAKSSREMPASVRDFAHLWTPEIVKTKYADYVLGMGVMGSYSFGKKSIGGELLSKIKAWHHDIILTNSPDSDTVVKYRTTLRHLCMTVGSFNQNVAIQQVRKLTDGCRDFAALKQAAWSLVKDHNPQDGLIVGSAIILSGNPKDGESLIRHSLKLLEEVASPDATLLAVIGDYRKRFPVGSDC